MEGGDLGKMGHRFGEDFKRIRSTWRWLLFHDGRRIVGSRRVLRMADCEPLSETLQLTTRASP
jgi:hypothetical protein